MPLEVTATHALEPTISVYHFIKIIWTFIAFQDKNTRTQEFSNHLISTSHQFPSASISTIDLRGEGLPVLRHSYRFTRSSEAAKNRCYLFYPLRKWPNVPLRNHRAEFLTHESCDRQRLNSTGLKRYPYRILVLPLLTILTRAAVEKCVPLRDIKTYHNSTTRSKWG